MIEPESQDERAESRTGAQRVKVYKAHGMVSPRASSTHACG